MAVKYKDYYDILNVDRTASQEAIEKQYRKLVRKYHPDVNKAVGAEDKFKEIQEAHEVLKDPEKRKRYDTLGQNWQAGQDFHPPPGWEQMFSGMGQGAGQQADIGDFSDFFDILFGGFGNFTGFEGFSGGGRAHRRHKNASTRQPQPDRPGDFETEIELALEEVLLGKKRRITIEYPDDLKSRNKTIDVKIPKGIKKGSKIRIPGQGVASYEGGPAGDLLLKVRFAPHPYFKPEGFDLHINVPVTPWEAMLGGKIKVPALEGNVRVAIKQSISSGQKLKVPGLGLKKWDDTRGDMIVHVNIQSPEELSDKEKELLEKLAEESSFKPRDWEK